MSDVRRAQAARVGFVVDHPLRDLDGGLLLAMALAEHGIEMVLVPQYEQGLDVPLLGLDALVCNYARRVNLSLAQGYAAQGLPIYILDTEGGILADDGPSTPERHAAFVRDAGFADILAGYFFWGRHMYDAFIAGSGVAQECLHLTGCPRFDVAAPTERWRISGRRQDHVLVNTNFPAVNSRFVHGDDNAAMQSAGYDADYVSQLLSDTHAIMAGMISTISRLAAEHPDQMFVVRPHPFERAEPYRRALAGLSNVSVEPEGDVLSALKGARALLHLNCGTAVEAILMGVPPLSLEFLNTPHMSRHASLPSRISVSIDEPVQLGSILSGAEPPSIDFAAVHRRYIEPYFHYNDGGAARRVAAVLARDLKDREPAKRQSIVGALSGSRIGASWQQLGQALAANLAGSHALSLIRAAAQPVRKGKHFRPDEVAERLARLSGNRKFSVTRARHPLSGAQLASLTVGIPKSTSAA